MEQLREGVLERDIISLPCQTWNAAWREAIDAIFGGKTFAEYAADFPSRNDAITRLANEAFAGVIRTYGNAQVVHYVRGLLVTGELKKSPLDSDVN